MTQPVTISNLRVGETVYINHFEHYGVPYRVVKAKTSNVLLEALHLRPGDRKLNAPVSLLSRTETKAPDDQLTMRSVSIGQLVTKNNGDEVFEVTAINRTRIKVKSVSKPFNVLLGAPELFKAYSGEAPAASSHPASSHPSSLAKSAVPPLIKGTKPTIDDVTVGEELYIAVGKRKGDKVRVTKVKIKNIDIEGVDDPTILLQCRPSCFERRAA